MSKTTHGLLYILIMLVPLLGWLNANGRSWLVIVAGIWPLPDIAAPDSLGASIGEWHSACATALLLMIGIHVAAALVHQFIFKDGLIRRML